MRRKVAAWPIGIVGNVLLFTVFLGRPSVARSTPRRSSICGARPAGRSSSSSSACTAGCAGTSTGSRTPERASGVQPKWAGARGRLQLLVGAVVLWTLIFYFVLKALGSWGPLADAWILTGSILATYGMARGWVEFWLIWIAVDLVGVPLLLVAGYYPSAIMYIVYGVFCVVGFMSWLRIERRERIRSRSSEGVADSGGRDRRLSVSPTVRQTTERGYSHHVRSEQVRGASTAFRLDRRDRPEDIRQPLRRADREGR